MAVNAVTGNVDHDMQMPKFEEPKGYEMKSYEVRLAILGVSKTVVHIQAHSVSVQDGDGMLKFWTEKDGDKNFEMVAAFSAGNWVSFQLQQLVDNKAAAA